MLTITSHRGFHMVFKNGWTASVQWGPGNYSDHHHHDDFDAPKNAKTSWESTTAEVAAWPWKGRLLELPPNGDNVQGWLDADDVLAFLNTIAAKEKEAPDATN